MTLDEIEAFDAQAAEWREAVRNCETEPSIVSDQQAVLLLSLHGHTGEAEISCCRVRRAAKHYLRRFHCPRCAG